MQVLYYSVVSFLVLLANRFWCSWARVCSCLNNYKEPATNRQKTTTKRHQTNPDQGKQNNYNSIESATIGQKKKKLPQTHI